MEAAGTGVPHPVLEGELVNGSYIWKIGINISGDTKKVGNNFIINTIRLITLVDFTGKAKGVGKFFQMRFYHLVMPCIIFLCS